MMQVDGLGRARPASRRGGIPEPVEGPRPPDARPAGTLPAGTLPDEGPPPDDAMIFLSPPPAPFPRIFPGL